MLNNYYFIGHGNQYEGYPILSGELEVISGVTPNEITYFFATTSKAAFRTRYFLMKNQFNSLDDRYLTYTCNRKLKYKDNVEISASIVDEITASAYIVNVNDIGDYVNLTNYPNSFNWSRHFSYKTNNDRYLQANILNGQNGTNLDNTIIGRRYLQEDSTVNHYVLLSGNFDIEVIASKSNNVFEYKDQFNLPDLSSCYSASNYYSTWYNKPINIPISNYEVVSSLVSTFSDIYYFNRSTNRLYSNLVSISSTTLNQGSTYIKDVYWYSNEKYGSISGIANIPEENIYQTDLMNFTFDESAYMLSTYLGNNYTTALYKIKNSQYIPIQSSLFINNIVGNFRITNYKLEKSNNLIKQNNTYYVLGDWIRNGNDLIYTSGFASTYIGGNLKIEQYTNRVNAFPSLIGVNMILGTPGSKTRISNIKAYTNTIKSPSGEFAECYISIDPASYVVAL